LKKQVEILKSRNIKLSDENKELGQILQAFRDGNYNSVEGAKMLADEQIGNLRGQISQLDEEVQSLRKENNSYKGTQERSQHMQSAFQSNNKAY